MKANCRTLLSFVISMAAALAQTAALGTISGAVLDDAGRPVPRAKLSYSRLPDFATDKFGHTVIQNIGPAGTLILGPDGVFVLSGLPSGRYSICAYGPQPNQVGGCEWDGLPIVRLAPGQVIQNLVRKIHEASVLTFRVADPNAKIAFRATKGRLVRERRFFLGVSSPSGDYHRAKLLASSSTQHIFQVAIPKQRSVRLFIDTDLAVRLSSGVQVETKRPTRLIISPGLSDQVVTDLAVN